jgi:hypothetical protein
MAMAEFTRPDGSLVLIEPNDVESCAPVPPSDSPGGGPLDVGTRISFKTGRHQDVKELLEEVRRRLDAAGA